MEIKPATALSEQGETAVAWLAAGGQMGARIAAFDWSNHPLGPIAGWPQSLKIAVRIMLTSRYAMWMGWGPEFYFFCNDAYLPTVGLKESWVLGASARRVWAEIWPDIGPRAEAVVATGAATWDEGLLLFLERSGFSEETYHTFSYSPLSDDDGSPGGMLCVVTEETERIIGERRLRLLRELAAALTTVSTETELFNAVRAQLAIHNQDLPFVMVYLFSPDAQQAQLACVQGAAAGSALAPVSLQLGTVAFWPAREILGRAKEVTISNLSESFHTLPTGPWNKPARQAVVVPIAQQGQEQPAGFLVAGINPFRPLDSAYRGFINLLAGQIGSALANARAYEAERRRAEALAEIDRAKTAFFSNVSHEFRTPLTLMLGPLEDALAESAAQPAPARERLQLIQRNGLRLLRLVNSLLDFSRLEAGRLQARYQPTDLAALTADLASVFRSTLERAGLVLKVACPPLPEPVYVDRALWEKIVLNLLSNAFKFTFEGGVTVALRPVEAAVELTVRDTGIGIAEADLPRLFERFHRVEGARGRTYEGSGIGLALVHELVQLHGGTVNVTSEVGSGTTFTITLPLGFAHLPADRLSTEAAAHDGALVSASAFVEEAGRWLPEDAPRPLAQTGSARVAADDGQATQEMSLDETAPRILLADDNADMRAYVRRLLASRYHVETVADGQAALEAARAQPPDLVLSDVMMPRLDGFGLLRELRADERSATIPVILLSARAGEEARIEGMEASADDYLVKPFSAKELLARVAAHLHTARLRREAVQLEAALRAETQAAKERLEEVLASISDQFLVLDTEWRYVYVNARVGELTGRRSEDLLGRRLWDLYPEVCGTLFERELRRAFAEQRPVRFEFFHQPTQHWFENRVYPSASGLTLLSTDITERKNNEANQAFLAEINRELEQLTNLDQTMSTIGAKLGSFLQLSLCAFFEINEAADEAVITHDWHLPDVPSVVGRYRFAEYLTPEFQAAGRAGEIFVVRDVVADSRTDAASYQALKINAFVCVPLVRNGRWQFSLTVYDAQPRDWRADEITLIGEVTTRVWMRLERARAEAERAQAEARNQFLVALDDALRPLDEPAAITLTAARILGEHLNVDRCAYADVEADEDTMNLTGNYLRTPEVRDIVGRLRLSDFGAEVLQLMRAGQPYVVSDVNTHEPPVGRLHTYHNIQTQALICVPLRKRGRFVAALAVHAAQARQWAAAEVELVQLVAARCWESIERARVARILRESEAHFRGLADAMPQLVWTARSDGVVEYYNSRGSEYSGIVAKADGTWDWQPIVCPEDLASTAEAWQKAVEHGVIYECEHRIKLADGSFRWHLSRALPLKDETGQVIKWFGTATDIHELRQSQQVLRENDRRKDEFLAMLAHELRNPLAPIRTAAQVLKLVGTHDPNQQWAREVIERQTQHLTRLVDDLLDVSRITRGKVTLQAEPLELGTILNRAVETARPLIDGRKHALAVTVPSTPVRVKGDLTRLVQVVGNLLTNAAKYTDEGGQIELQAQHQDGYAVISVRDNGMGLTADLLPHVFDLFTQADRALDRSQGGLGIGLTLVRTLVELHGGQVEARSPGAGQGSEFIVRLPVLQETAAPVALPVASSTQTRPNGLKVLIVEDNLDAAEMLRLMLRLAGHEARIELDGAAALATAQSFQPQVILCDIGLPGMNGYEIAQKLRAQPHFQQTKLIALSGYSQEEDRRRSKAAGFDYHLSKPVEPEALTALLASLR